MIAVADRTEPAQSRLKRRYGRWAVVTGASSGIGREAARHLAANGLGVVLVARRSAALHELAAELERDHGAPALAVTADLATNAGVEAVRLATEEHDVGLLVASAGFGSSGPFLDADVETEAEMIDVNARAAMRLAHAFGRRFRDRGRGGIVLMSSIVAFQGVPNAANYAATKAYVQALAEALRVELEPDGVDVVASAPGPVRSGFAERASMTMGATVSPEVVARRTIDRLGRNGTVRPGMLSKALELALRTLPRRGRVRMMGRVMGGMAGQGGSTRPASGV